jgi:acetylornithine/succinyldiaminopimelate/putrescine aminotransferase
LLLAVGFSRDCSAEVVDACRERGLLANNVRPNAVRFMPPLNVTDDEIDRACDILEDAIAAATSPAAK